MLIQFYYYINYKIIVFIILNSPKQMKSHTKIEFFSHFFFYSET